MKREFLFNILFLVFVNALIKPLFVFGIDLKVQNLVGDAYGLYFALFNLSYMFQTLNDLGLQHYNNRQVARQGERVIHRTFANVLYLKAGLAVITLIAGTGLAVSIGYRGASLWLLCSLLVNQILLALIFYLRSNVSGLQQYRLYSILSVADRLLMIVICSALIWGRSDTTPFRIEWFALAQTLSYLITAGLFLWFHPTGFWRQLSWRPHLPLVRRMVRSSLPYAWVVFLMSIYIRIDGILLERLLPDGEFEASVFAFGYRLLDSVNTIGLLFAGLLLPMFAKMLAERSDVGGLALFGYRALLVCSLSVSIGIYCYRQPVMQLLHSGASPYMADVLGVLMFAFNASATIYVWVTLLTANQSLRLLNRLYLVGTLANIILNAVCILQWKALGAALATTITQLGLAAVALGLCKRTLQLYIPPLFWWQLICFIGAAVLLCYGSTQLPWASWVIRLLIAWIGCAGTAIAIKMIDLREIREVLSNR